MQTPEVAVVIPFYQDQPGPLQRALASVRAQRTDRRVLVVVVDDSSPLPARDEINAAGVANDVTLIPRANGGPGAARNTALAFLPRNVRYVALLDSDDTWSEDHLERALQVLSSGFDFYFADHLQLGQTVGAFERGGRLQLEEHRPLAAPPHAYAYQGDMFDQIMRGNLIGTSTVVFDRRRFPETRFREEFKRAGEDYLCWMDFAKQGARFAFSTACEARYGRGVNVYSGAQWGTEAHLERVHNELRYRTFTRKAYDVSEDQAKFLRMKISTLRDDFAKSLLHMLARKCAPPLRLLVRQAVADPLSLAAPMGALINRLRQRRG